MAVLGVFLAVTAVLCAVVYFCARSKHNYWAKRGVAHDKPTPFVGNLLNVLAMKQPIYGLIDELYNKYPNEPVVGFYGFTKPMIIIRDLDVVKDILIKNFSCFVNRSFHCDEKGDPLGFELLFGKWDDDWRRLRQKISLVFSSGKIKEMYPLVDKVGSDLNRLCATATVEGAKQIDFRDFGNRFAVDVITACAFGSEGGAIDTPDTSVMLRVLKDVFQLDFKSGVASNLMFFQRSLYNFLSRLKLGFQIFRTELENDVLKLIDQALKQRVQNGVRTRDIFDYIVFSTDPEFEGLKKKAGSSFQMLLGGSETSSTTIFFTMYLLAQHQEAQKKLQTEIREALQKHGGQISYEVLNKLEYLDQVVNESLRLFPILPFLDRLASKNYQIPGTNIIIEKGTAVFIPAWAIQKDAKYFPDPEKFIPERFSKSNGYSFPDMAFLPFGAGPRYCVGKRFGIMVVKNFLLHFLKDYDVHLSDSAKGPLDWNKKNFTLSLLNGMHLIITKSKTN